MQLTRRTAINKAKTKLVHIQHVKQTLLQVKQFPSDTWLKNGLEQTNDYKNHPEAAAVIVSF